MLKECLLLLGTVRYLSKTRGSGFTGTVPMIRYGTVINFSVKALTRSTYVKKLIKNFFRLTKSISEIFFLFIFVISQSGIINSQRYWSIYQCFKQTNRYGTLILQSILRYLFGVKWRRSQGCWIRLSGSTGDLFGHLPLLPEQAHEGLRKETLRPLKSKI